MGGSKNKRGSKARDKSGPYTPPSSSHSSGAQSGTNSVRPMLTCVNRSLSGTSTPNSTDSASRPGTCTPLSIEVNDNSAENSSMDAAQVCLI